MSSELESIQTNLPDGLCLSPWLRRFPIATFLIALILAIVAMPLTEQFRNGDLVEGALLTTMMLLALPALGGRRKTLAWGIALVTPALAGKWLTHWWSTPMLAAAFLVPGLLFLGFVSLTLFRFVFRSPRVNSEVLCAGIAGYLMLGLLWAFAYILVARLVPDSFVFSASPAAGQSMKGFTAIYFSFITLCTVGYGDIVPLQGTARMLVVMEAMTGTFYMTVLIARLVSMYSTNPPETQPTKGN